MVGLVQAFLWSRNSWHFIFTMLLFDRVDIVGFSKWVFGLYASVGFCIVCRCECMNIYRLIYVNSKRCNCYVKLTS